MPGQTKLLKATVGLIAALLVLAVAGRLFFPPARPADRIAPPGLRRPLDLSLILPTLGERRIDLAHPPGKVLLINVWASWCGPCVAEMPSLEKLHQTLGGEGLYMIGVTSDPPSAARGFAAARGLTFDIASDPASRLARKLGVGAIPDTFVIDAKGRLALRITGATDWADPKIIGALRELLNES